MKKIFSTLLSGLLLFVFVVFNTNSVYAAPGDIIFEENFNDIADGVAFGNPGVGGGMKVQNGILKGASAGGYETNDFPALTWNENFEFTVDYKFPNESTGGFIGIQFVGLFDSGNTEFNLQKAVGDSGYAIIKNGDMGINIYNNTADTGGLVPGALVMEYNVTYTVRVIKYQNQFEFYINDELIIKTALEGAKTPTGAFFFHYDTDGFTQVEIDNLVVKESAPIEEIYYLPGETLFEADFTGADGLYGEKVGDEGLVVENNVLVSKSANLQMSKVTDESLIINKRSSYNFDVEFKVTSVGSFGFDLKLPVTEGSLDGILSFELVREADSKGKFLIKDDGAIISDSTNVQKGGIIANPITLNADVIYQVKVIRDNEQFEVYVDDVLRIKFAARVYQNYEELRLFATADAVEVSAFDITYAAKITNRIILDDVVLPDGILVAESFNTAKLGNELYELKDPNGPRLMVDTDTTWKEPFIKRLYPQNYVSAEFELIPQDGLSRVGFYMNFTTRIYVDVVLSADKTSFVTRISRDGDVLVHNNEPLKGGKVDTLPIPTETFNLGYSIDFADGQAVIKVYLNGLLTIEHTLAVEMTGTDVEYRLFTANTKSYVDNLLITTIEKRANVVSDYQSNYDAIENESLYLDFSGTPGQQLPNFAHEGDGFVFDAYGKSVRSASTNKYNASYTGPNDLAQFTYIIQMQDMGTYKDGTEHIGGLSFRVTNGQGRNDLEIKTDAGTGGTVVNVFHSSGVKLMDSKSVELGGGFNPDLIILPGTKFQVAIYVQTGGYITVYINEHKMIQGYLGSDVVGGFGFRSWNSNMEYDNLLIAPLQQTFPDGSEVTAPPVIEIPLESINLTSNTSEITTEESAIISINRNPYNATFETVKWYVNDVLVSGQSNTSFTFSSTEVGTYQIKAEMDGIMSPVRTITVVAVEVEEPITEDSNDLVLIISIVLGSAAVVGLGAFVTFKFIKFKKK